MLHPPSYFGLKEEVERLRKELQFFTEGFNAEQKNRWEQKQNFEAEIDNLQAQLAQAREALKYLANESNWDQEDNNYQLKRPGGFRQEGIYLLSRNLDPWIFAAEALAQEKVPTAASLVGTAPVICLDCGGEINPDYGRCRRCG